MKKMKIVYETDTGAAAISFPTTENTKPLDESFGKNLDSVEKARKWLTNPHNWHSGNIFIVKWEGLLCTVSRYHGMRLVNEPLDNGLAEVVMFEQFRLKRGGKNQDEIIFDQE